MNILREAAEQTLAFMNRVTHWQEGKPDLHDMKGMLRAALAAEQGEPVKVERQLRRMLCALRHGSLAYMDDGEASWGGDKYHRQIDYMKESPEAIEQAWREAGLKKLTEQANQPQAAPQVQPDSCTTMMPRR